MLRSNMINNIKLLAVVFLLLCFCGVSSGAEKKSAPKFRAVAFYTGINDAAHVSFVHEANRWFTQMASRYNFSYDSTNNWNNMNAGFLSNYQVVIFLDTRPDSAFQRAAFKKYMESGGAWMGFHFCAFALTPSAYPQNWD